MKSKSNRTTMIALIGIITLIIALVISTIRIGRDARDDTVEAVRSVSLLYLDELAGRREQVVSANLQNKIEVITTALNLLSEEDLSSMKALQNYQSNMKKLFKLEKFAFVDSNGLIYTSLGTQDDIDQYQFDYKSLSGPEISIKNLESGDKKVIIAVPVDHIAFNNEELVVCFMEIDMQEMLTGVSMQEQEDGTTFSNIYTDNGVALTDTVLGGLAVEDNLLEAMSHATFTDGYSYEKFVEEFSNGSRGVASFTYNDIYETFSYVPVTGTDWQLTYLIRESVISDEISSVTDSIIRRSSLQSIATFIALLGVFAYVLLQNRKNVRLQIEKETSDAENRIKQQELEQRLALQEQLLQEERESEQQNKLITALSSDYWSVYYVELDKDEGICYQSHTDIDDGVKEGEYFRYLETFTNYANRYVTEAYREEFLKFIQIDSIKEKLSENRIISYTYVVRRHDKESYEMVRFAGVRHPEDRNDHLVRAVGACFCDVDAETRKNLAQNQALSDALDTAEQANKAKTAFLSNMSHEIRTPMNAIIGLDSIALNDPETPEKTKEYLVKMGDSAQHLLNLINDILDMSRIESGRMVLKKEEFSFRKLLETINTMFSGQCTDKGLDYHCYIKGKVDDYYIGDNMKLRQILINILGNAVKFTPEGGTVEFNVECLNKFDGQSTLRFVIKDNGIGISEEFLPHIFDTFAQEDSSSTNRYGSSGLGLAITKNIVEMMNGNIEVQSKKGEGSTFTVDVTLLDSDRKDDSDDKEIHPDEMSVLIVDDDPIACEHARLVLSEAGIAAETAESGMQALEMVKLQHARRQPYNLILIDWKMPEMDGVETSRQIREIVGDESAIIILTAYRWDDVLEEALKAGVDSFIAKPLFVANVLDEFSSAVKKKKQQNIYEESKTNLCGRRILLAEDVQINAEIMKMVLQAREIEVDLAENGKIALDKYLSHPAYHYDAILMDMRMPEMDGLEASRRIRAAELEDSKTIPIIALTANAFDEDVQRSMQAGLNAHLSKPVQPEVLYETLESLIARQEKK
ncbi:MAG: response regulator [Erysipelotrichaceae bacterium]|nr:response regulator [Erysipelotrichaceae bacterium]